MHLRLSTPGGQQDSCVLVFDAQAASDASLHPVPGEECMQHTTRACVCVWGGAAGVSATLQLAGNYVT